MYWLFLCGSLYLCRPLCPKRQEAGGRRNSHTELVESRKQPNNFKYLRTESVRYEKAYNNFFSNLEMAFSILSRFFATLMKLGSFQVSEYLPPLCASLSLADT